MRESEHHMAKETKKHGGGGGESVFECYLVESGLMCRALALAYTHATNEKETTEEA